MGASVSESTELQRAVENLTTTIGELRKELVRKDVYESDQRARDREVAEVMNDVRDLKNDFADHKKSREEERKEADRERRADRRILYGAVLASVATLLTNLYTQAQGVG